MVIIIIIIIIILTTLLLGDDAFGGVYRIAGAPVDPSASIFRVERILP
jgi:hypothetical protein